MYVHTEGIYGMSTFALKFTKLFRRLGMAGSRAELDGAELVEIVHCWDVYGRYLEGIVPFISHEIIVKSH